MIKNACNSLETLQIKLWWDIVSYHKVGNGFKSTGKNMEKWKFLY